MICSTPTFFRKYMRSIVRLYLSLLARLTIWKHRPKIIAVTGSVGKSGTKEAISVAISGKFDVRTADGNLNNEFGVPLSIMGYSTPKSIWTWIGILISAPFKAIFSWHAPDIMVLEYGIDAPGDMDVLLHIARPHISVVTNVESVHLENFNTWNDLATEKGKIVEGTLPDGIAILNFDNFPTRHMAEVAPVQTLSFGLNHNADFSASDISLNRNGTKFKVMTPRAEKLPVETNMLGKHVAYSILPAIAVAEILGISGEDAIKKLTKLQPLPGRQCVLKGKNGSTIIDSTYNAEPASMLAALDIIKHIPTKRRIVVLGDMLELGSREKKSHIELGHTVAGVADLAILIGPRMEFAYNAIRNLQAGRMNAFHFTDRNEAIKFLSPKIRLGDLILVKGSQGIRLESVVKNLMSEKLKSEDTIVRQSKDWLNKKDILGNPVS